MTYNIKDFIPLAHTFHAEGREYPGLIVSPQIRGEQFSLLLRLILNLLNGIDEAAMQNSVRFLQEFR